MGATMMSTIRQSAVAGSFYPNDPVELKNQLKTMLNNLPNPQQQPKALIVPHAGYYYSGAVAAHAYASLSQLKSQIKRVVLLGPSHRVYLQGCAVPDNQIFNTPLGDITIDTHNCQNLVDGDLAQVNNQAHVQEHSLEVQLPFLQQLLDDFVLLPIVVGQSTPEQVSALLTELTKLEDSLLVVSTDLSHFHPYDQAKQLDTNTIEQILQFQPNLDGQDACGCYSVNGLLHFAKTQNWQSELLNYANSGDINHSKDEVVGYASFILY
jgi:AmmeMemoRadiSam system protein B